MADLTYERAYQLAQKLTTIDGCPRLDDAVEAIADDLMETCRSREEAELLVHEARFTWKRWQGTAGLIGLLQAQRRPSSVGPPEFPALGPKPPVECALCNDFGTVYRNGVHEWCTCRSARVFREEAPDFIDKANAKRIGVVLQQPVPIDRKVITKEDVRRDFRERTDRTEQMIREARATLDNAEATRDQREIAREILRSFDAEDKAC